MGMYTELIFGADLKKDTPENVIEALKYMIGDTEEKPKDFPLPNGRCEWLFRGSSYYFGVNSPVSKMWKDDIGGNWVLSTRSNIKNYESEIETFLEWIKPYIDSGSGYRDMYAIVTYEEAEYPNIYYLHDDKMVNIFAKLHVQLKEILDDLNGYSPEEVGRLYEDLQGLVPQLIKSHERFSELSFLNNETLESQMRKTLDLTYILEARSKKIVKSKKKYNK